MQSLYLFLNEQSTKKRQVSLNSDEWTLVPVVENIPLQENYYDCGVFACKYAEFISRRAPLTFTQVSSRGHYSRSQLLHIFIVLIVHFHTKWFMRMVNAITVFCPLQSDIPMFRRSMIYEIANKKLLN